jgi:Tol biopolymer transport system component
MKTTRIILILALVASLGILAPGKAAVSQQTAGELFEKALYAEEGQGDLQKAIALYQDIVKRFPESREIAAKALLHVGMCYEKLGKSEARSAYGRLLKDYSDQLQPAKEARSRLTQLEAIAGGQARENGGLVFRKIDYPEAEYSHQARLSPDGKKMLYIGFQEKEPQYNLRVLDFASGKSLTLVEGFNADAATLLFEWSPDGKKVVYVVGRGELWLVNADGGKPEPLWATPEKETYVRPLDWSDQNRSLLLSLINLTEQTVRLAVLPEKGTVPRIVVSGDASELADIAQFSPDGKLIVGMKKEEKNTDIYAWKVEGGEEIRITDHPAEDSCPLWSPDGKYILFLSDRARTVDLWAIPMAGSRPAGESVRLQAGIGKNKIPSDMTRTGVLAFYAMSSSGTPADLFVLPVDPKTGAAAGTFRAFADYPTQGSRWSPDGSRIAGTSRKGNIQLPNAYISAGGASEELEIPARGYWMGDVEWSRDGKQLLFEGWNNDDERAGIFRIFLDDLKVEPVQPPGERVGTDWKGAYINLRWLPLAGRYIFFKLLGESKEEIFMMDPEDYRIERVGEKPGMDGYSIPSPDGRFLIAPNFKNKTINLLSVTDETSRFVCALSPAGLPAFSWSPDGKSFIWNEDRWLRIYSVVDGTSRTLAEAGPNDTFGGGGFMNGTPNTAFSPDGTKVAYVLEAKDNDRAHPTELWIVDATGQSPRKIADAPASHPKLSEVVWHPSGKLIFAQGNAAEGRRRMFEHWIMENFLPVLKK